MANDEATEPEMSDACAALCDAAAGMDPEELAAELAATGRFADPEAVATYLLAPVG